MAHALCMEEVTEDSAFATGNWQHRAAFYEGFTSPCSIQNERLSGFGSPLSHLIKILFPHCTTRGFLFADAL